jgi:hypothetical protein
MLGRLEHEVNNAARRAIPEGEPRESLKVSALKVRSSMAFAGRFLADNGLTGS